MVSQNQTQAQKVTQTFTTRISINDGPPTNVVTQGIPDLFGFTARLGDVHAKHLKMPVPEGVRLGGPVATKIAWETKDENGVKVSECPGGVFLYTPSEDAARATVAAFAASFQSDVEPHHKVHHELDAHLGHRR